MGPDGGPYIAINENSGNIELEDNTGTTVAIWDDANSQWDFQNNPISNVDSLTSNSVNTDDTQTKTIGAANHHYAGDYDGADADARLDNALAAASENETIYLEAAEYSNDRTLATRYRFIGTGGVASNGTTTISGDWTINNRSIIEHVSILGSTVTLADKSCLILACANATITVSSDDVRIIGGDNLTVTFESGTSGSVIDSCTRSQVTDNGSNTVGDLG